MNKPFFSFRRFLHTTQPGTSLLVALGLVTLIALVSIGVTTVVVSSIRDSANVSRANEAFYAAEGALETGLLANHNAGAGFNTSSPQSVVYASANCSPGQPIQPGCTKVNASYEIKGQVPATKGQIGTDYIIPIPGTGNVGTNCDSLNPVIDPANQFIYTYNTYINGQLTPQTAQGDAIDHPCNWNKLEPGQPVSIPLYTTDANGVIQNPTDLGLQKLVLKIRPACENGNEFCPELERYDLDTYVGDSFTKCDPNNLTKTNCGDTMVSWTIDGTNSNGDVIYSLRPNNNYKPNGGRLPTNSEIYELAINNGTGVPSCAESFCVLKETRQGIDLNNNPTLISDFLLNQGVVKPILKLNIIHSLEEFNTGNNIPYLEYQIEANTTLSPADVVQTVTAEGFSGSFKQVLQVKQPQQSNILEYVIQQ